MKTLSRNILVVVSAIAIALALGIWVGRISIVGPRVSHEGNGEPTDERASVVEAWTCSMHPQIRQPESGPCPICGMDLIPVKSEVGSVGDASRILRMTESAKALAEIETTIVRREFPTAEVRLVGKLDYDETRVRSLAARFPARIDRLFVNYTGVQVGEGEHMAEVYSPDLLTAQRELLTAHARDPASSTTRVARDKLRLWDLQADQIDTILEKGEAQDRFVLRAPVGGVVVEKNIQEGDYVNTGEALFKIADLSELWLFLDAYESDLTWLRYGQDVAFRVEAFPGENFHGQIAFIEPEVNRRTRTVSVRVNVPNRDGRLKPGMFARGVVKTLMTAGGQVHAPEVAGKWISPMHPEIIKDGPGQCDVCGMDLVPVESLGYVSGVEVRAPLLVPSSAVLRTGKRAIVYVEIPESGQPSFEGREISLGPRAGDDFVVVDGLAEGDRVVTNGAFKIDSALQIQARPSMMNPSDDEGGRGSTVSLSVEAAKKLLPVYLELQNALAEDALDRARASAGRMHDVLGHDSELDRVVHAIRDSEDLEGMRRPQFELLSNALIRVVQANGNEFVDMLFLQHCPMVYPDRGADWLQGTAEIHNPYFGATMINCGETKGTFGGEAR